MSHGPACTFKVFMSVILLLGLACAAVFTRPVAAEAPASVHKLTIAMDGWGGDQLDPWDYSHPSFIQSYLNTRLATRDEHMQVQPFWALEWSQTEAGIDIKLNPQVVCQNGEAANAETLKTSLQGLMGQIEGFKGSFVAGRFRKAVESLEVRGPYHLFIKTQIPDPGILPMLGGYNYHIMWFGPAQYLLQVGHKGYVNKPIGCGPYAIKEYYPGDRVVLERWEKFWGTYPYMRPPQHKIMEWLKVPNEAARYALLKSRQVDMALNIPYPIAKNLPRSEDVQRGVNPKKGDLWTQTLKANGKMQVAFDLEMALREGKADPAKWGNDPTLKPKVRQALALAIDRDAIRASGHGFLLRNESIYSMGSFGWRQGRAQTPAPYDPARAKQLLAEAGYPNGFDTTAHFAEFSGRPNQREALDIIASNWKAIGVNLKVVEHDPFKYYADQDAGKRAYLPINEWSWGRQENGILLAQIAYSSSGFRSLYNDKTDAFVAELSRTLDKEKQLKLLAQIEDEVFRNHWVVPLYDASAVYGYTDRVQAHPMPEFGAHFLDLQRIILRGD